MTQTDLHVAPSTLPAFTPLTTREAVSPRCDTPLPRHETTLSPHDPALLSDREGALSELGGALSDCASAVSDRGGVNPGRDGAPPERAALSAQGGDLPEREGAGSGQVRPRAESGGALPEREGLTRGRETVTEYVAAQEVPVQQSASAHDEDRAPYVPLRDIVDPHRVGPMLEWLDDHAPHVIADELARMDAVTAGMVFRLLDKDRALDVFEELEPVDQQQILSGLRDERFRELVEEMDPDDRARMLREAPAKVAKKVLAGLSPRERRMTAQLLGYPEGSVGYYMTPEVVALPRNLPVAQALQWVRTKGGNAETVYTLPVVDGGRRIIGVVELRDLVLSSPDAMIADLVAAEPVFVRATDSAEKAARLMQGANLINLPVVDSEDRLVGLLTIDDAIEVIEAADSEDVARQAGAAPWEGHYMAAGVFQLARYRAMWLTLLLVAATLTVSVTDLFEGTLEQAAHLALFIPLIIGAGGNAGAQAATSCVRAVAVGEVRGSDLFRVVWRECRVGLLLGTMLALIGVVIGGLFVGMEIAVVVGITLVLICAWAATIGGTMPLLAKKLRIDPAVISAPMVTTLVDATGLIIYFTTAKLVLGI
ncbi:magnesium transporter [Nocardia otitidiscaviarum]|uniref:magnesium transporter n=1 Tax=Nocardia otitidiscaviarum TaxID=1823 RepID=UPI00245845A6|nr:magnesium transporter [Nocardia otitidiscaviarum]